MITISICLIVKNEEKVLGRCLESLKTIADEIILVDTGSSDNTKAIAKEFNCKIYDFKWIDDFSAARNFSFSKASMDYIYVADADEVIDEDNINRFIALKKALLPEIEMVQMYYTNQLKYNTTYNYDKEYRPKLYKRLREFKWIDQIHETVRLEPVIYDSDIEVIHMPEGNHANRDFDIFQKMIYQGTELSSKLRMMYARELFIAGKDEDFLNSESYFERQMEEPLSEVDLKIVLCVLTKCGRIKRDVNSILKNALKNMSFDKASSEVCFEVGEHFFSIDDFKEASIWYYNAGFETEPVLNLHYHQDFPLDRLAKCYYELGNLEQAKYYEQLKQEVLN
ncbi:MAG: glycosyl transferase family 2 [Anaerocolumna sp.]|jgi:glycosyltransferase involved in cell wall biosynthesis|nr:glycosyl transferase family 2 [Anaerocolumna sp.]